jgi:TRAP-type C4-dicarboxylate transport system permease small subunit
MQTKNPSLLSEYAEKVGRFTEMAAGALCVTCFVAMTLVALMGVFFRYVMENPFMWTEEVARYLLVWMGFTAISIALRQGRHIKIEIAEKFAPKKVSKFLNYLVDFLIAVFMGVLFYQGCLMTANNMLSASTFHLSMEWIVVAVPVGAGLTLLQLFLGVIKKIAADLAQ